MKVLGFNHLSVGARNLEESARFYQTVLGMELIPTYNFGFKTKYLRCGDLQLIVTGDLTGAHEALRIRWMSEVVPVADRYRGVRH